MSQQENSRLAAIDVGTNSFHLVVVKLVGENGFALLDKEKIVVRLGESAKQIKSLSEGAMNRGVEAMKLFKIVSDRFDAPIRAVATSAVREAENGEEFIERVLHETGIEVQVVSGIEEARLIYLGVLQALPLHNQKIALFDIGGGSTEVLIGEHGRPIYANSYKIGAIRMTQRFFPNEEVTRDEVKSLQNFLRGEIYFAAQEVRKHRPEVLVASSGTAQTIAAMVIADRGDLLPESLNGIEISKSEIRDVVRKIIDAPTFEARSSLPGCDPRRADILVAGAIVLQTIVEEFDVSSIVISTYALREGIVLDWIRKHSGKGLGIPSHLSDLRFETVMNVGRMYDFDEEHGKHVAFLALRLYDELAGVHKLPDDSRELLEAASILHDIGYYISHTAHHKHALYLILHSEMMGFHEEEIHVIANTARYHRKSHPKTRHPEFAGLSKEDKNRVRILAGLLRIADALDRTHRGIVRDIRLTIENRRFVISLLPEEDSDVNFELWSAERKKGLLEQSLGIDIRLTVAVSTVS